MHWNFRQAPNLAASRFDVRIVLASASTNNEERDQMLVGPEFFDATGAAEARYVATAFRALASVDDKLAAAKLDLNAVYTNAFVQKANAKYPKG